MYIIDLNKSSKCSYPPWHTAVPIILDTVGTTKICRTQSHLAALGGTPAVHGPHYRQVPLQLLSTDKLLCKAEKPPEVGPLQTHAHKVLESFARQLYLLFYKALNQVSHWRNC